VDISSFEIPLESCAKKGAGNGVPEKVHYQCTDPSADPNAIQSYSQAISVHKYRTQMERNSQAACGPPLPAFAASLLQQTARSGVKSHVVAYASAEKPADWTNFVLGAGIQMAEAASLVIPFPISSGSLCLRYVCGKTRSSAFNRRQRIRDVRASVRNLSHDLFSGFRTSKDGKRILVSELLHVDP
jgi:hypothetical protein